MELVPILSTIILVGTIATFILAVFAYILYKVRERKSRQRSAEQRPYMEPRRQPALAPSQQQMALPGGMGQGAPASMYIAPTSTLPPQGPIVEVDEMREAQAPQGGWQQPPQLEPAAAPQYARQARAANGHSQPAPRLAPPQPQYDTIQTPPRPARQPAPVGAPEAQQPGSMFWEYTDEGFVPVDPRQNAAREQQRRLEEQRRSEEQRRRVDEEENSGSAWL